MINLKLYAIIFCSIAVLTGKIIPLKNLKTEFL